MEQNKVEIKASSQDQSSKLECSFYIYVCDCTAAAASAHLKVNMIASSLQIHHTLVNMHLDECLSEGGSAPSVSTKPSKPVRGPSKLAPNGVTTGDAATTPARQGSGPRASQHPAGKPMGFCCCCADPPCCRAQHVQHLLSAVQMLNSKRTCQAGLGDISWHWQCCNGCCWRFECVVTCPVPKALHW